MDLGYEVILVLLDFIAAFDTIDHSILLTRREQRFGISGKTWKWLGSYLEDRTQFVSVNNLNSATSTVKDGVLQGSVLGPLLLSLYVAPLENIFKAHGINVMVYADDTVYHVVKPDNRTSIHYLLNILIMKNTSNDTTHGYKVILCSILIREYHFRFNLNSNKTM